MAQMRTIGRARRPAIFLALVLLAFALALSAEANPHGWVGASQTGCTCHATQPSPEVVVSVKHLPQNYTPKEAYTLMVTVEGGPPVTLDQGGHAGGFNLRATSGTLRAPRGSDWILKSQRGAYLHDMTGSGHEEVPFPSETYGELTFTHEGANRREWTVEWIAPAAGDGDVTFFVAGLSANGDHKNSIVDGWNKTSYIVAEGAPSQVAKSDAWMWGAVLAVVGVAGLASWRVASRARSRDGTVHVESDSTMVKCPDCGAELRASHLGSHRRKVHG